MYYEILFLVVGDSTARDTGKPSGKKSSELSHILGTSDTVPSDAQLDLLSWVFFIFYEPITKYFIYYIIFLVNMIKQFWYFKYGKWRTLLISNVFVPRMVETEMNGGHKTPRFVFFPFLSSAPHPLIHRLRVEFISLWVMEFRCHCSN